MSVNLLKIFARWSNVVRLLLGRSASRSRWRRFKWLRRWLAKSESESSPRESVTVTCSFYEAALELTSSPALWATKVPALLKVSAKVSPPLFQVDNSLFSSRSLFKNAIDNSFLIGQLGDHVIPLYTPQCYECDNCKSPLTNICTKNFMTQVLINSSVLNFRSNPNQIHKEMDLDFQYYNSMKIWIGFFSIFTLNPNKKEEDLIDWLLGFWFWSVKWFGFDLDLSTKGILG